MTRSFILVDAFGQVVEHLSWSGEAPTASHIEIVDSGSKANASLDLRKLIWKNGAIERKPVIYLAPSKRQVVADGIDEITIEARGLLEEHGTVEVSVNGATGGFAAGDSIAVTTVAAGPISVRLVSKSLFAEAITLLAVAPT